MHMTFVPLFPAQTEYESVKDGILERCQAHRRVGETLFDTAERLLIHEALGQKRGQQKPAAALLGCSRRIMNYHCEQLQLRPADRKDQQEETP